jgi:methyl-accepting chemotaxis protein
MRFRWTISAKTVAITWVAVGVTAVAGLAIQRSIIRQQGIDLTHAAMRNTVLGAEHVRATLAEVDSALDAQLLKNELRNGKDFRQSRFYSSVPIVGAMRSIERASIAEGYRFRVPSRNPRNPKNAATPDELAILDFVTQNKSTDYFQIDEQRNEMVFARPIVATAECLTCHGDQKNSPTHDGKDILGFTMEGFKTGELRGAFVLRSSLDHVDALVRDAVLRSALWITPCAILLGLAALRFSLNFRKSIERTVAMLQRVASGDLTQNLQQKSNDELGDMAVALNQAIGQLTSTLSEIQGLARNVACSSRELTDASEQLSRGVSAQAGSIQETSASMEEMTTTVRQNAGNAAQANQIAGNSRDEAENGGRAVISAVGAMKEITSSSRQIADIISTIDEIAFQTNLLALNAAVEAARAGDQGRGFAVVAAEVRILAQRSATAAKEIKGLILDSGRKVEAGTALVNDSGETLNAIVGSVKRLSGIVSEIATASSEQASGIEHINAAILQMDRVTQENSAQTEQLAATALSLNEQAARMLELSGRFQLQTQNRP